MRHLATVLEAAAALMRSEVRETVAGLSRCWGLPQSVALDAVFSQSPGSLLTRPDLLIDKAFELIEGVDNDNAMRPTIGIGILVHKLTRLTGAVPGIEFGSADRYSAFAYRSGVIGILLGPGDVDAAVGYHRQMQGDPLLRRNELWSLVTFGGDSALTPEIGGATRMVLRRTATEVIGDIATLPDPYLYYLVTTAIPVLLDYDPSFGSSIADLRRAIAQRLDHGIEDARARSASLHLMNTTR